MSEPIFVHTVACKLDAWTYERVQEEAARKRLTTSEYVRALLETYHRFSTAQTPSNFVYRDSKHGTINLDGLTKKEREEILQILNSKPYKGEE
jgi:hypothetical protein